MEIKQPEDTCSSDSGGVGHWKQFNSLLNRKMYLHPETTLFPLADPQTTQPAPSFRAVFDGVHVGYQETTVSRDVDGGVAFLENHTPAVVMGFSLAGHTEVQAEKMHLALASGQQALFYAPPWEGFLQLRIARNLHQKLIISLSHDFFMNLVQHHPGPVGGMIEQMAKQQPARVSERSLPLTPSMRAVAHELIGCNKKDALRRLFLEAKVLELLMLQIEQVDQLMNTGTSRWLSSYEKEQLYFAKEVVSQQVATPPTLKELAKRVGMNEFKLKRGFKQLFGTTVFGYVHALRMAQARHLLVEHKKTVAEVADAVGYLHAHHFTAAFKKTFGYLPSALHKPGHC